MVGSYCEVHDKPTVTNTERQRTTTAIALGPAPGDHNAYFFMSLQTGKKIRRQNWTELPINDDVIRRVHELAENEDNDEFEFYFAPDQPVLDEPIVHTMKRINSFKDSSDDSSSDDNNDKQDDNSSENGDNNGEDCWKTLRQALI